MKTLYLYVLALTLFTSCVSQKKYTAMQDRAVNCENELNTSKNQINLLEAGLANEKNRSKSLEQQMEYFKSTNTDLLARLSDLSVVSKSGAESIKKSLEALNEQNKYIKDLTSSIQRKDSINLVLVMNLKRSLDNFEDEDINIEVKKGVVYVSISDKMLFRSGSYNISSRAEEVIGKIAKIINDHKELDILVEGHTDNVPISTECMVDNWDLSVKRATSIVRLMQTKFAVQPIRMTAGGRSEYLPKTTNATTEGRAVNRRTEIIILPKLDQFFELLEPPTTNVEGQGKG
ncbi:OmpA/MotB family protein [Arenibacter palladensis]|uniref:OmpA/MotB family protein n=1 Tax=Arenibacter palladensis TaxID=237373 RepID=UPI0026E49478|nr:OmpA family protein [Arenibacter palladensis]MDO6601526.1 OmpA family protein [Arenibacter palladensis]|tara:strand:- start:3692 stop:4558 length:867 start_codon:yes stop_codon:yes gene_type:complete